jgi:hypothetical protein
MCPRRGVDRRGWRERFKEEVKVEANRLLKSRFMVELNKAKNTLVQKGYNSGHKAGMERVSISLEIVFRLRARASA